MEETKVNKNNNEVLWHSAFIAIASIQHMADRSQSVVMYRRLISLLRLNRSPKPLSNPLIMFSPKPGGSSQH